MYLVLRPVYHQTSEPLYKAQGPSGMRTQVGFYEAVTWREVGTATSMDDAKARFGGSPVLKWVRTVH